MWRDRKSYLVIGAGFSGAVIARELAERLDCEITIFDERPHVAGNCHTERDPATGVMVHRFGPHIFNTNRKDVWEYVNRFGRMMPFINRVKASNSRGVFSLPINLHTINQLFGKRFTPEEARSFIASLSDPEIEEPKNFEEQALKFVGRELYETFFRGYTLKQWGCDPTELSATILKRLPVRFNYDDNYYNSEFQGIPEEGYTALVEKMLDHPRITVKTGTRFEPSTPHQYDHLFYTGPIDGFFGYAFGRLGYRTVTFERVDFDGPDYQGNAVINYTDLSEPFTRVHEHKHFAPWEVHEKTVAFKEFSKETEPHDQPFYPKRLTNDKVCLAKYRARAGELKGITFLGRLATYRYLDMDKVIGEALDYAKVFAGCIEKGENPPVFPNEENLNG